MAVARSRSVALLGLRGEIVEIEADLAAGVPGFMLIGLADTALAEARERVRSACQNSGLDLPAKRITINLSPAALPKHGSAFDLGIALAALAAAGVVPAASVARAVHLGELGLDGRVRPGSGVLPAVLAAKRAGSAVVMVPEANAHEAELVDGIEVIPVASLRAAAIRHGAELEPDPFDPEPARPAVPAAPPPVPELGEVVGNRDAVDALVIAAAGGHHLLLVGPPGAGKTMLASRLPGILPPLDVEAAIEVASIRSLSGVPIERLPQTVPFEAPHHTASPASIIGGGSMAIRPGAVARAAHGVLFLDECPEFSRVTLDALRQPLESGTIVVQRANLVASFPADFQLVLAANPCPCGFHGTDRCSCTPMMQRRYLGRLSGPLLDRIDIQLRVPRLTSAQLRLGRDPERAITTAAARERVAGARQRAQTRLEGSGFRRNAEVPGPWLRGISGGRRLPRRTTAVLDDALERGRLTMRGYDRVLRVAWTIADLAERPEPGPDEVGRAIGLRMAVAA